MLAQSLENQSGRDDFGKGDIHWILHLDEREGDGWMQQRHMGMLGGTLEG